MALVAGKTAVITGAAAEHVPEFLTRAPENAS